MAPKQTRHQMSNDQLRHLKRFFSEHANKKWNNHKKQGDLRDLLIKTGLSREQVYTYCRNKKHRDKLRRESRRDSLFKDDRFNASLETFGALPFGSTTPSQIASFNLSSWEQENTEPQTMIQVKGCNSLAQKADSPCNHLNTMLFSTKVGESKSVEERADSMATCCANQTFNPLEGHQCSCLPLPKSLSFGDFIVS